MVVFNLFKFYQKIQYDNSGDPDHTTFNLVLQCLLMSHARPLIEAKPNGSCH